MIDQPHESPNMSFDKSALRASMRSARRSLTDQMVRSEALWEHMTGLDAVARADRILLFATIPGEPEVAPFGEWCRSHGKHVAVPDDVVDPAWPDVVIVPGLAFTIHGDRLGQGGGWYDRFLARTPENCITIGVGFDVQIVEQLPVEPHDVRLDWVVTESGCTRASGA